MSGKAQFKKLFSPYYIGKMRVKNRIIKTAAEMNTHDLHDAHMNQRTIDYVEAVARGGAGMVNIFGDDSVLQFGGGTLGHPWGNAAGAAANRVAVEACVEARNMGRELEKEGKDILTNAAKHSPELKAAMETWKEIKFEFDTVDKLDVSHK